MKAYESQMDWNQQEPAVDDKKNRPGRVFPALDSITLEGHLVAKPKLNTTKSGKSVAHFALASNHSEESVSFFDVEAWEGQAISSSKYLDKGSRVIVVGKLRQDRWVNDSGEKKSRVKIVAQNIIFIPKRQGPSANANSTESVH